MKIETQPALTSLEDVLRLQINRAVEARAQHLMKVALEQLHADLHKQMASLVGGIAVEVASFAEITRHGRVLHIQVNIPKEEP